jgi:hypothetical protein
MAIDTTWFRLSGAFARMVASFQRREVTPESGGSKADEAQDEEWVDDDCDEGRRRAHIITVSLLVALISGALISIWLGSSPRTVVVDAPPGRTPFAADTTSPMGTLDSPVDQSTPASPGADASAKEPVDVNAPPRPSAVDGAPLQPEVPAPASSGRLPEATARPTPGPTAPAPDRPRVTPAPPSSVATPPAVTGPPVRDTEASANRLDGSDIIDWLVKESPHRR